MAGEFTAGLSGGQRKLLLFEIVAQRVNSQSDLLICLDEPFAGVTDDFIPFIVDRLNEMRKMHQIVLVTNDHVDTLKTMADNTITVSAFDRCSVQINHHEKVDRIKAIAALSVGESYEYRDSTEDIRFFIDTEIVNNDALRATAGFSFCFFCLCLATFWGSEPGSIALILVAGDIISFYSLQPYLLSLVDWRNYVSEEAEALLHASKTTNKLLKTALTSTVIFFISVIQFAVTNGVIDGLESPVFWLAMLCDSVSLTFPFIGLGLYSRLSLQAVENFGNGMYLFMTFFSTTFSPGSGIPVLKELRYLFPRFYFWCLVPGLQNQMEGCPKSDADNLVYLILSSLIGLLVFLMVMIYAAVRKTNTKQMNTSMMNAVKDENFIELQRELYGRLIPSDGSHINA